MNTPPKPWMSQEEIDSILSFLSKDDIMLEYGCGGSTMFFPQYVKEYHSIESDPEWADLVKKNMPENVELHTVPITRPCDPNQKHATKWKQLYTTLIYKAYKPYIEKGSEIGKSFNKILIDGRARPQCARYMYDFIDNEAVIFVHDWQPCRMHYRAILEKYKILKEVKTNQCLAILSKK
jgi:hypothetical protein